jgi:hypothetical protein
VKDDVVLVVEPSAGLFGAVTSLHWSAAPFASV